MMVAEYEQLTYRLYRPNSQHDEGALNEIAAGLAECRKAMSKSDEVEAWRRVTARFIEEYPELTWNTDLPGWLA